MGKWMQIKSNDGSFQLDVTWNVSPSLNVYSRRKASLIVYFELYSSQLKWKWNNLRKIIPSSTSESRAENICHPLVLIPNLDGTLEEKKKTFSIWKILHVSGFSFCRLLDSCYLNFYPRRWLLQAPSVSLMIHLSTWHWCHFSVNYFSMGKYCSCRRVLREGTNES